MAEPIAVIDDDGVPFAEIKEAGHLLFDTFHVAVNLFDSKHFAHVGFAGRIADHGSAAAHQRDGLMACPLHVGHSHNRNVMTDMKAVGSWIETDVENGGGFELFIKLILKGHLGQEAAFLQNIKNVFHGSFSLLFIAVR